MNMQYKIDRVIVRTIARSTPNGTRRQSLRTSLAIAGQFGQIDDRVALGLALLGFTVRCFLLRPDLRPPEAILASHLDRSIRSADFRQSDGRRRRPR
jgi:hypothetical protein